MSINVIVNGNPISIRHKKMVLSDLNQIKKNERDRRRRLRLEQVRQQSKEISNRLLERAKNVAKVELDRLEKDAKTELQKMHNQRLIELSQQYEQGSQCADPIHIIPECPSECKMIIEEERRKNRLAALKRGKEALLRLKEMEKQDEQRAHQERLRQVREVEKMRSSLVANLSKKCPCDQEQIDSDSSIDNRENDIITIKSSNKSKRLVNQKSPDKISKISSKTTSTICKSKSPQKPNVIGTSIQTKLSKPETSEVSKDYTTSMEVPSTSRNIEETVNVSKLVDDHPRTTIPTSSISPSKVDKIAKYNPVDYTQETSTGTSSTSSSNSISGDSSYFSDNTETDKYMKTSENLIPDSINIESAESAAAQLREQRQLAAQRRGEDALLREKVRRDYEDLLKNLDYLAREERKLEAAQGQCHLEDDVQLRNIQRRELQKKKKQKLENAVKTVINNCKNCCTTPCTTLTERIITLPSQDNIGIRDNVPSATWQDPPTFHAQSELDQSEQSDKEEIKSRNEQILEMLQKVERQKRLLLQEFGADLPNDIFNASLKKLFEASDVPHTKTRPPSPEIKVLNMSDNEASKKKTIKKKPGSKKIEIAIQTSIENNDIGLDKSIQVEIPEKRNVISDEQVSNVCTRQHIEPVVTIITPEEVDSSSGSTTSVLTGVIIDIDKNEVKVTPKKKKSNLKISKKSTSKFHNSHYRSTSKKISPAKDKLTCKMRTTAEKGTTSTPRQSNVEMKKCDLKHSADHSNKSESRDNSTESSYFNSNNSLDQSTNKPYIIQSRKAFTRRKIQIRDTSDTSTSFASPPSIKPGTFSKQHSITPILEMLDSSINDNIMVAPDDISPVSTPQTPSPRTMRIPSNIPHPKKVAKLLKIPLNSTSDDTQSSVQNNHSTLTDISSVQPDSNGIFEQKHGKSCLCANPGCKLMNIKFNDIQTYAEKNCPEILKKYEDLQNMCTERIISLTDLIERVRNEQKGMEFSVVDDETKLMDLPPTRPVRDDLQSVRRLVESIETIHNQLAKTLYESQKIIASEKIEDDAIPSTSKQSNSLQCNINTQVIQSSFEEELKFDKEKEKPQIISDEIVNIRLNRYKIQKPQTVTAGSSERNSWPPSTLLNNDNDLIEKLSNEILEQSKGFNTSSLSCPLNQVNTTSKTFKPLIKSEPMSKNDLGTTRNLEENKNNNLENGSDKGYIPVLTGIPKMNRHIIAPSSGKPKPPVTLLNAPYRSDVKSPAHELSTIIEFDTPDTASRSPLKYKNFETETTESQSKTRKSLTKNSPEVRISKDPFIVKPSVHVAPLPPQNQLHTDKSGGSSPSTLFLSKHISSSRSENLGKSKNVADKNQNKENIENFNDVLHNIQLEFECDELNGNGILPERDIQLSDDNNAKDKLTSTSSTSISGLSGISEINSTHSSEMFKFATSPEEMENELKKLGLGWAVATLKKTRKASALSSSSNSDVSPLNTARRLISPTKKSQEINVKGLTDLSDVSSISIKEASKSTERAVLLKGRTSTPNIQSFSSNCTSTNSSRTSIQEVSDTLTVPNTSLMKTKLNDKKIGNS